MSAYDLEIIQAHINQPDAKLRKFKSDLQEALAATSEGVNNMYSQGQVSAATAMSNESYRGPIKPQWNQRKSSSHQDLQGLVKN